MISDEGKGWGGEAPKTLALLVSVSGEVSTPKLTKTVASRID